MVNFIRPSDKWRFVGSTMPDMEIGDEQNMKEIKEAIASGLTYDQENDLFIKEGYGALVGVCPSNCDTIDELLKYTHADFRRKTPGKPSLIESINEMIGPGRLIRDSVHYGYHRYVEEGAELVIGPGCSFHGQNVKKAVYCRNYLDMLKIRTVSGNRR